MFSGRSKQAIGDVIRAMKSALAGSSQENPQHSASSEPEGGQDCPVEVLPQKHLKLEQFELDESWGADLKSEVCIAQLCIQGV